MTNESSAVRKIRYCEHCDYTARDNWNLERHKSEVHLECNKCKILFSIKEHLYEHLISVHDSLIACDLCEFSSFHKDRMKRHKFNVHDIKVK